MFFYRRHGFLSTFRSTLRLSPRRCRASRADHLPALLRLPYAFGPPGGRLRAFFRHFVLDGLGEEQNAPKKGQN
jgi:hypothetical protein